MNWTTEKLKQLKELHENGLSITEIGKQLGVTRNAVAAKIKYLGFSRKTPYNPNIRE